MHRRARSRLVTASKLDDVSRYRTSFRALNIPGLLNESCLKKGQAKFFRHISISFYDTILSGFGIRFGDILETRLIKSITMKIHHLLLLFFMHVWPVCSTLHGSRYMWLEQPGCWSSFEEGIPIGNGRLGEAVYGDGVVILGINENSIWTRPFQNRTPTNATVNEPIVHELFLDGNITEGNTLKMAQMRPTNNSQRLYGFFWKYRS